MPDRPVEVDGCERTEPHFVWMTSWCLAKTLLSLLEGGTVRCEVVRLEPCSGAIRCENSWACGHEGRQVWPATIGPTADAGRDRARDERVAVYDALDALGLELRAASNIRRAVECSVKESKRK